MFSLNTPLCFIFLTCQTESYSSTFSPPLNVKYVCTNKAGNEMGTGLTVTSWCCVSLTVLCFTGSRAVKLSSPQRGIWQRSSGGRRRRDTVGVRGEADKHHKALWWWSECECRSHTFNKGWCSLSQKKKKKIIHTTHYTTFNPNTKTSMHTHAHTVTYTKDKLHLKSSWTSYIHKQNGQREEQRLLLQNAVCTSQPPQLSLTVAFYIQSSTLIWNIKD